MDAKAFKFLFALLLAAFVMTFSGVLKAEVADASDPNLQVEEADENNRQTAAAVPGMETGHDDCCHQQAGTQEMDSWTHQDSCAYGMSDIGQGSQGGQDCQPRAEFVAQTLKDGEAPRLADPKGSTD